MIVPTLTPELIDELRQSLERERDRLVQRISALVEAEQKLGESQGEESDAGGGMADVASDANEQTLELSLERAERIHLAEIEAALRRIKDGRYGVCEECGLSIPVERLQALPWTPFCVRCAGISQRQR
jgi:DnaK suppressor protein